MHGRSIITILLGLVATIKNDEWHTVTKLIRISSRFRHSVPRRGTGSAKVDGRQTSDFSDVRTEEWIFNNRAES